MIYVRRRRRRIDLAPVFSPIVPVVDNNSVDADIRYQCIFFCRQQSRTHRRSHICLCVCLCRLYGTAAKMLQFISITQKANMRFPLFSSFDACADGAFSASLLFRTGHARIGHASGASKCATRRLCVYVCSYLCTLAE